MATLITGASSGIGEEFAHHYAAEKHDLVLVARSEDKLNTLADTLRSQHGIQVTVIALDLSEPDAAQRLWEETNRARLEIDVLVNNAGFGTHCDVADDNPDRLEQEVRLNCFSAAAPYGSVRRDQSICAVLYRSALGRNPKRRHPSARGLPRPHRHLIL